MKYDLVIFDLDGTLLDTVEDLRGALNHALTGAGYAPKTRDEMRLIIGGGVYNHVVKALPADTDKAVIDNIFEAFKSYYDAHCNVTTKPFPGIPQLLEALKAAGIKVAVNSNKLDLNSRALIQAHFGPLVDMAIGDRVGVPRKPAPDSALEIMAALNAKPKRTLYVGDGDTDLLTAQNAGTDCAWVSWGYRSRSDLAGIPIPHFFDNAGDLRDFILQ